jgi:hypothetical protein
MPLHQKASLQHAEEVFFAVCGTGPFSFFSKSLYNEPIGARTKKKGESRYDEPADLPNVRTAG